MKRSLWAACVLGGLLLAGCAPAAVVRVGHEIGATLYLPTVLPPGLRLSSVQRIGAHMAYLSYTGGGGRLSVFESPQPISPPPGATRDKHGVWRVVAEVGGETTRGLLMRLPGAFVEVMAVGVGARDFARIPAHWQPVGP